MWDVVYVRLHEMVFDIKTRHIMHLVFKEWRLTSADDNLRFLDPSMDKAKTEGDCSIEAVIPAIGQSSRDGIRIRL